MGQIGILAKDIYLGLVNFQVKRNRMVFFLDLFYFQSFISQLHIHMHIFNILCTNLYPISFFLFYWIWIQINFNYIQCISIKFKNSIQFNSIQVAFHVIQYFHLDGT
jgi:hypothetical protein